MLPMSTTATGRKLPTTVLSYKHFQLRSEVLKLYRHLCRITFQRCNDTQRNEIREFAKHEIRTMKHIDNIDDIKNLIRNGENRVEQLETTLNLAL